VEGAEKHLRLYPLRQTSGLNVCRKRLHFPVSEVQHTSSRLSSAQNPQNVRTNFHQISTLAIPPGLAIGMKSGRMITSALPTQYTLGETRILEFFEAQLNCGPRKTVDGVLPAGARRFSGATALRQPVSSAWRTSARRYIRKNILTPAMPGFIYSEDCIERSTLG
jgi:hypothetical protein